MDLRKTVADILEGSNDKKIDEVTRILNDGGVGTADDLKYFNWNSLKELGGLSTMDINKIMRYIQENFPDEFEEHKTKWKEESSRISKKMDLRKTVADIFGGSSDKRIDEVTRILNDGGVGTADDLKNFNWKSLNELGGLSTMDINRIMRYVQENFPDEYKEHKRKWNEERKLQNEADILKCKDDHERELQEMKIRFEEEKEARVKEQRELEEEFTRSRQDQQNSSKKTGTTSEGVSHGFSKIFEEFTRMPWSFGNKDVLSIDETISEIFQDFSQTRITFVVNALKNHGIKTVKELKQFDEKPMKDMGLLDIEVNKIMDYLRKQFPKNNEEKKRNENPEEDFKSIDEDAQITSMNSDTLKSEPLSSFMKNDDVNILDELKKGEWKLQQMDITEFEKIVEFLEKEMDLRKTVADILGGSSDKRIDEVTRILNDGGVGTSDDLKYFDLNSLEELRGLSNINIYKIMRYVQKNFPDEYKEHKRKRNEERKLQNEADILKCNTVHERKLQEMKMRFAEEKEARVKEQREQEEEFTRSIHDQQNSSKKTDTTLEGVSHGFSNLCNIVKARFISSQDQLPDNEEDFPKDYKRHEKRRDEENRMKEELSKYKTDESRQQNPSKLDEKMNIEEVIHKIFDGCSAEARIGKIKEILCCNGLKRADELRHFDWKSLEDFGLTSAEANRILDFVKKNFPKDYKRHEKRRDEENRMKDELSKYKTEIIKPSKLGIEEAVANIFGKAEVSKIESVTRILKSQSIKMAVELKYFERDSLAAMGLDGAEINKIMAFVHETFSKNCEKFKDKIKKDEGTQVTGDDFKELTVEEAVAKILEGCSSSRMYFVTMTLMEEGASTSKEMKYFDRNNLEELGVLENEEIDKIVKFIQES